MVVDLFAGAGLFSSAFQSEGFEIGHAVEMNREAAATYAANFDGRVEVADLSALQPHGRCDVLIAGPPCQGFSTLGKRDAADPRNRLALRVAVWAETLRPQVVVIENVAAFLDSPTWGTLSRRLESLGYCVHAEVHNAIEFGVPQFRSRSVTFASRRGPISLRKPRLRQTMTVEDAWIGLAAIPDGRHLHVGRRPSPLALARMKRIPRGGDKRDIMRRAPALAPKSWWEHPSALTDVWGRMERDKPANTLRTVFVNPSKGRYIHPEQNRVITLREGARIQSIPDDFVFASDVPYVVARQIGNSVPPLMGQAIARSVLTALG